MFDENGKLLGCWSCNDAKWRHEYFNHFMDRLGIEVLQLPKKYRKLGIKQLRKHYDYDSNK
jgi:hypothetical protein